jgi:hypothetical protein
VLLSEMKAQFSVKIKLNMNKLINSLILIFFVLALWGILSIEVKIIPLIHLSLNEEVTNSLNSVYINLSYSYVAGVLIYLLTVVIPYKNRKRVVLPLIKNLIIKYYKGSLFSFTTFYLNERKEYLENNNDLKEYSKELRLNEKLLKALYSDEAGRKNTLKLVSKEFYEFNVNITSNEDYLSIDQLNILNKLRQDTFIELVDQYIDTMGVDDVNKLFYETFKKYIQLVVELKKIT